MNTLEETKNSFLGKTSSFPPVANQSKSLMPHYPTERNSNFLPFHPFLRNLLPRLRPFWFALHLLSIAHPRPDKNWSSLVSAPSAPRQDHQSSG